MGKSKPVIQRVARYLPELGGKGNRRLPLVSLAPWRRTTVGTQRGARPTASVETLQVRAVSRIVGVEEAFAVVEVGNGVKVHET